jgi:hypothetical protein
MFEVDSRQFDGLEIGNRRPQQQSPTSVVGQSGRSRDVRVKSGSPPNIRHSFDSSGRQRMEWDRPRSGLTFWLRLSPTSWRGFAWTVLAQGRGYEARVAAIEFCDRRIRRATLDQRYLHLLARCGLCAKSVRVKASGRLREKCRHESIEA